MRLFKSHRPLEPAKRPAPQSAAKAPAGKPPSEAVKEVGGPEGPEPTRYGDWERKGICSDF